MLRPLRRSRINIAVNDNEEFLNGVEPVQIQTGLSIREVVNACSK